MNIKEGIIIATSEMKKSILRESTDMKDYTFMTYEGLLGMINGSVNKKALFALMSEYNLSYDIALEYMHYIPYVENKQYNDMKCDSIVSAKNYLVKNDLLEADPYFFYSLRNKCITFLDVRNTKQYKNVVELLKKHTTVYEYDFNNEVYSNTVKAYQSINDEVYGVCNEILKLNRNGIPFSRIHISNVNNEYLFLFERMLNSYNIPFYFTKKGSVLHTAFARRLLELMKTEETFRKVYEQLPESEFKSEVLALILDYDLADEVPNKYIYFMERKLKNFSYNTVRYEEMVSFDNESYYSNQDYVFYVGLNQGSCPKIHKDEGYLNDKMLESLGLPTSLEKNREEKKKLKNVLLFTKNLYPSYSKRKGLSLLEPSSIISELELKVENANAEYGYSSKEDLLRLSSVLSIYDKTHEKDEALDEYSIKNIQYRTYDNTYKGLDKSNMTERFNENHLFSLSYSSMKTYFQCPFRYYCDNLLKLDTFDQTTSTRLGTYSHAVLEDSYKEGYVFEESLLKNKVDGLKDLSSTDYVKDEFYFDQMKKVLSSLLSFNHEHESASRFDTVECEAHIEYFDGILKFHGYIDKLMYTEIDGEIYAAIIDYKTGKDIVSLDNVWDGFHLQLPSYMFLLSKYEKFKDKKIHIVGIYLQKVNMILLDNTKDIASQISKSFALQGYTIDDKSIIPYIDPNYYESDYIQSMKTIKDGSFYKYAKIVTEENEKELVDIIDEKIHTTLNGVMNTEFGIHPKRIGGKDQSCIFCKYRDICFKTAKDFEDIDKKEFPKKEE